MNIARSLAMRGHDVWTVDRGPRDSWIEHYLRTGADRIRHLSVDLAKHGELASAQLPPELDAIVHAAVITATTEVVERNEARDIVDSNVGGTVETLQLAVARSAMRFVYISSPSAIGEVDSELPVAESVVPRPSSLYGITKFASEQIVERWAELYELEAASVRIAQPYGPGERVTGARLRTSPIWEWLRDASVGEQLPTGPVDRARDWTFVEDTAEGIVRILEADTIPNNLYHLGLGMQSTVEAVVEKLESSYGPLNINLEPGVDELNPNIRGHGRPPLDVARFESDFGWKPGTTIDVGMDRYIAWWEEFRTMTDVVDNRTVR
jgi:UDP-glucose 4-epimerase